MTNKPLPSLTEEEKQRIVAGALGHQGSASALRQAAIKRWADTTQRLQEEGVDPAALAEISAIALARLTRPSYQELARALFPVDRIPDGAITCFTGPGHEASPTKIDLDAGTDPDPDAGTDPESDA